MTDFEEWLEQYAPANHEESYQLNDAIRNLESSGIYEVEVKSNQVFIRSGRGDWLRIASDAALGSFRKRVDSYCPDSEMGWEASQAYRRAMEKDD
jgi:hypothetical protein